MKFHHITAFAAGTCAVASNVDADALFEACAKWIGPYLFECSGQSRLVPGEAVSLCNCDSTQFIASYVDCVNRSTDGNKARALKSFITDCKSADVRLSAEYIEQVYINSSDSFVNGNSFDNKTASQSPLRFEKSQIDSMYRAQRAKLYNSYVGQLYGGLLLSYFAAVFTLAAVSNFFRRCAPALTHEVSRNSLVLWFRQKLVNPALFKKSHSVPVKWGPINMSLPTRAQTWVLLGYLVMLTIFLFIKYDVYSGNVLYPSKRVQLSLYIAVRSGILCVSQFPLIYALAGRNNILLFLTGLSYDTMSCYHRWIARVMYTCAFIHVVSFTVYFETRRYYTIVMHKSYIRFGVAAAVSGGLIMFFSLRHFRERCYETFISLHWVFVISFTVCVWHHLKAAGHIEWIYAAVAVWAFDRAARLARIVVNGITARASAELHSEHLIKLKVKYNHLWSPGPGAYVFVHFLSLWGPWESHPFSVYPSPVSGEKDLMILCIRMRKGKTHQLGRLLAKRGNFEQLPIFIDGPYGHAFPIAHSDTMVFIAGGIGFTAMYSYVCRLKELGQKKRIVFVWSIRNYNNTETFKDELAYLTSDGSVSVVLYLTSEPTSSHGSFTSNEMKTDASIQNTSNASFNEKSANAVINHENVQIVMRRLDIGGIVRSHIVEAPGSVGFAVCGPDSMNDDVRYYGSKYMHEGNGRVDVFVEAFNW